jgi:hypothetical protein
MKIKYWNFRNPTQEQIIKDLIEELGELIPRYVLKLDVYNWDDDGNCYASVEHDIKYMLVKLNIYNLFFAGTREEMRERLIHELTHLHTNSLFTFIELDILDYVRESNAPLAEHFRRQLNLLEEGLVVQVSHFIAESTRGSKRN